MQESPGSSASLYVLLGPEGPSQPGGCAQAGVQSGVPQVLKPWSPGSAQGTILNLKLEVM